MYRIDDYNSMLLKQSTVKREKTFSTDFFYFFLIFTEKIRDIHVNLVLKIR